MVIGIIALILGIILFFKVWGMCNNVKDIKRAICSQQYEKMKEKEKDIVKSNTPESSPFSIGQLVIVKSNESQFRINSISRRGDSFIYYSEKYNKDFSADEIEDFDEYWKTKGNK